MCWTGNGPDLLGNIQEHATEQRRALGGVHSRSSSKYRGVTKSNPIWIIIKKQVYIVSYFFNVDKTMVLSDGFTVSEGP